MSYITVGQSCHPVAYRAGCEAVQRAVAEYVARYPVTHRGITLAIVSASPGYAQESLLRGIRHTLGEKTLIVGCSSVKQFTHAGMSSNSVAVMLFWADSYISAQPIIAKPGRNSVAATVRHLVREVRDHSTILAHAPVRLVQSNGQILAVRPYTLVLFGANSNGDFLTLVDLVGQSLGPAFQVIGSVAEGCPAAPSGYQYLCGLPYYDSIVGCLLTHRAPSAIGWSDRCAPASVEPLLLQSDEPWEQPSKHVGTSQMVQTLLDQAYQKLDKVKHYASSPARYPQTAQAMRDRRLSYHRNPSTTVVADLCRSVDDMVRERARQSSGDPQHGYRRPGANPQAAASEATFEQAEPLRLCRHLCAVHHNARQALARLGNTRPASALLLVAADRLDGLAESTMALELLSIREAIGYEVPLFGFTTAGRIAASHPATTVASPQSSILYLIGA